MSFQFAASLFAIANLILPNDSLVFNPAKCVHPELRVVVVMPASPQKETCYQQLSKDCWKCQLLELARSNAERAPQSCMWAYVI